MLTGNIGEWSEIYTFLKLLADGELYAADDNLNKLNDIYYPILSILREESNQELNYKRNGDVKICDSSKDILLTIPSKEFKEHAEALLNKIKTEGNSGGSFSSEELETFLTKIKVTKLTASSSNKQDITIVVHDFRTGLKPQLGFSIKSQLGGASTLLNPGAATNFTYKLERESMRINDSTSNYGDSNSLKVRERISQKTDEGYKFIYLETGNPVFTSNLRMIDSLLPEILSYLVQYYYIGRANNIKDLTNIIETENPLEFETAGHKHYEHKIKNFLMDVALGMTPARVWEGNYIASGGYIIVREDGELVCYHIYNINQFKEYLFNNTRLETPSTSRYNFGNFYSEESELRVKLNLQVRFTR